MRLIMAVSQNGYLCRGPEDDMSWTGPLDKLIFKVLTHVGGPCLVGSKTYDLMPRLPEREVLQLSRKALTLEVAQDLHPDSWLLGGPKVAGEAWCRGLISEFYLCRIDAILDPKVGASHIKALIQSPVKSIRSSSFTLANSPDVTLEVFKVGS